MTVSWTPNVDGTSMNFTVSGKTNGWVILS